MSQLKTRPSVRQAWDEIVQTSEDDDETRVGQRQTFNILNKDRIIDSRRRRNLSSEKDSLFQDFETPMSSFQNKIVQQPLHSDKWQSNSSLFDEDYNKIHLTLKNLETDLGSHNFSSCTEFLEKTYRYLDSSSKDDKNLMRARVLICSSRILLERNLENAIMKGNEAGLIHRSQDSDERIIILINFVKGYLALRSKNLFEGLDFIQRAKDLSRVVTNGKALEVNLSNFAVSIRNKHKSLNASAMMSEHRLKNTMTQAPDVKAVKTGPITSDTNSKRNMFNHNFDDSEDEDGEAITHQDSALVKRTKSSLILDSSKTIKTVKDKVLPSVHENSQQKTNLKGSRIRPTNATFFKTSGDSLDDSFGTEASSSLKFGFPSRKKTVLRNIDCISIKHEI
eukprot:763597-Hanusia_phi.AAC.2